MSLISRLSSLLPHKTPGRWRQVVRRPLSVFSRRSAWDLTALLNAADPRASQAERHLWLIRLFEWLRHRPDRSESAELQREAGADAAAPAARSARSTNGREETPRAVLKLRFLLTVLEKNPTHRENVAALLARFWIEIDAAALLADFGFSHSAALFSEIGQRLRLRLLPGTPATTDLSALFNMLFSQRSDAAWLRAIDDATLTRLAILFDQTWAPVTALAPPVGDDLPPLGWRAPFLDGIVYLTSSVMAAGFAGSLRPRMSPEALVDRPFRQLPRAADQFITAVETGRGTDMLRDAQYLRALLQSCRDAADTVADHLEEHGVSVDVVFEVDQLRQRTLRIEDLLTCTISPTPQREIVRLLADLVDVADARRSVRALFARHYSLLARKVAERSAATGEHYITRDVAEYRAMLAKAAGGGLVIAGTTFIKFFVLALGASAFWGGFLAGLNYAGSFLLIHLAHWTVATKQPAMTAPAMADKLGDVADDSRIESFVDEVAHLIRSQVAGIAGNLAVVAPAVYIVQWGWRQAFGHPLVGHADAAHTLHSLSLLGFTPLFAALTGVLLFASSLIAGWAENWFVWHRLDSAIAWNPNFVARLGALRAQRWARFWRANISGFASNISLGMMLGLVPAVTAFFGLPLEVRHVTLSTGQLSAAIGSEGFDIVLHSPFWWCVAGIVVTALLNLGVSFLLAFRVALRSRGIRLKDRGRIYRAIRRRLRFDFWSFLLPSR
jgi:site-specific recombinase